MPKGHTRDDVAYCIEKYDRFIQASINPEVSFPDFKRLDDLPDNIRVIINDCGVGQGNRAFRMRAQQILFHYMGQIYDSKKYGFEVVLCHWMRTTDCKCINLMDIKNLKAIIVGYHFMLKYNFNQFRISLRRYTMLYGCCINTRWDKYCV